MARTRQSREVRLSLRQSLVILCWVEWALSLIAGTVYRHLFKSSSSGGAAGDDDEKFGALHQF